MSLNIVNLMSNPDAKVIIYPIGGTQGAITGFISTDVSIGGGADWQSPMDSMGGAMKSAQSLANLGGAAINTALDMFGLGGIPQVNLTSFASTVVDYMGTNKPKFSLPLIFPAYDESSIDPRTKILQLLECVYPSTEGTGVGSFMKAPLGYSRLIGKEKPAISGYVNVQIGRWLQLPYLVVSNVESTFSKEVTKSLHAPLYAKATVSFTFIKTPNYAEVRGWFIGVGPVTPSTDPTKKNKATTGAAR